MIGAVAVPVLTWHAMNVAGEGYADNEHVAFREDLETIHRLGFHVVRLHDIARALVAGRLEDLRGCVGLSFDDGADFDFRDLPHPAWGPQRAMANILADFRARHGAHGQPRLHATSFTVVSREARAELDADCMIGCRWWNDDWWREAEAGGLISIESHGWDHNHEGLTRSATSAPRGGFEIASHEDAEAEIARASRSLKERRGRADDVLFAYPYGRASAFLAETYFPDAASRDGHGVFAAFTTDGAPITPEVSRWRLPRYVFGWHWKSTGELEKLLGAAARGLAHGEAAIAPPPRPSWRDCLRTWEVNDARVVAGELFRRSFGHEIPDYPRHFVLVYSPPPGSPDTTPRVVAYVHQSPFEDVYLTGGMCVDAAAYRSFPRWLFEEARREGGLATIVTRESIAMLGDSLAAFGHVGEPRARAADLRTGYIDTGRPHLMVVWRKPLGEAEKARIVDCVQALGPF
jgi:peptidoglycan/xylan/chitin deacetylase (PgdA/CDA1 family)